MCCNDVAAIGALKTLSTRGLQAGRDIALIGFDDLTICRFTQPALSTIQFAPSEIAPLAFRASWMKSMEIRPSSPMNTKRNSFFVNRPVRPNFERSEIFVISTFLHSWDFLMRLSR